jgi:hypothetical protein
MASLAETVIGVLAGVGGLFGIRAGTEEPRYTVVDRIGVVEIRHYGARLAAEAVVSGPETAARSDGFRKVAGYIFGGNTRRSSIAMTAPVSQSSVGSEKISMTAPVAQEAVGSDGQWRVQFFMPAKYGKADLPVPNDPGVRIVEVAAQDYAVLRFSGSRGGQAVATRTGELKAALAPSRWRAIGVPTAWFYDPPWTAPFLRRNEVAVTVARAN